MFLKALRRPFLSRSAIILRSFSSATTTTATSNAPTESFYTYPTLKMEMDRDSEIYQSNMSTSEVINSEFSKVVEKILRGGPESAHKKLTERGKLSVRERISKLLDEGSPFLEFS